MESTVLSVLALAAFGLLVALTGGIIYLTLADWRDRRRREQDTRGDRPNRRKSEQAKR
ncbi:hypothetical protein J5X98_16585 [Leptothermofonsia sichuanensis E412]|uniref:hypothetical protein n=1 Tax=Leptothermofonsia sichuanensis TaxID=2917832 RepID=UPI001CA6054C|nr:hypothetical protein [Leptothermofonsia sichuanensis]QZZ19034.1 hypothetical protein J5X98_16585 [Leptothermofonsia sichuanensis E412]